VKGKAKLISHTDGVTVRGPSSRAEARRRLKIPLGDTVFVSAGFLQPHKGFERAIEAVRGIGSARLYLVGSVRDATTENLAYAASLRALAAGTPGVELVDRFVSDEEFDAWIAAADAVVLPYRRSWSSGALARAQAIGTPAVVTAVGGLPEQASERDVVVRNDEELAPALEDVAARASRRRGKPRATRGKVSR
jgi:glycosyltransferase involved in cell wall biosynthesis